MLASVAGQGRQTIVIAIAAALSAAGVAALDGDIAWARRCGNIKPLGVTGGFACWRRARAGREANLGADGGFVG